jgi:hypothetical protein
MANLDVTTDEHGIEWTDWSGALPLSKDVVELFLCELVTKKGEELCRYHYNYILCGDTLVMKTRDELGQEEFFEFQLRRRGTRNDGGGL